jgi:hypothetical protein
VKTIRLNVGPDPDPLPPPRPRNYLLTLRLDLHNAQMGKTSIYSKGLNSPLIYEGSVPGEIMIPSDVSDIIVNTIAVPIDPSREISLRYIFNGIKNFVYEESAPPGAPGIFEVHFDLG